MDEINNLQAEIESLQEVVNLKRTKGWQHLVAHFERVKSVIQDKLLLAENLTEIVRLQERYRAFNSMLEAVDEMCATQDVRQQELQALVEDKQYRDKYGLT